MNSNPRDVLQGLVSLRTLASLLECSPKTIRDWLYKNRKQAAIDPLPYYRLHGLLRFKLNDVMKWIERRRIRVSACAVARSESANRNDASRELPNL